MEQMERYLKILDSAESLSGAVEYAPDKVKEMYYTFMRDLSRMPSMPPTRANLHLVDEGLNIAEKVVEAIGRAAHAGTVC